MHKLRLLGISTFINVIFLSLRIRFSQAIIDCMATSPNIWKSSEDGLFSYFNFEHFDQLKFDCDVAITFVNHTLTSLGRYVSFIPSQHIIVSKTINLTAFEFIPPTAYFLFTKIKGFDLSARPMLIMEHPHYWETVYVYFFMDVRFDFYLNGTFIDEALCNSDFLDNVDISLFAHMDDHYLDLRSAVDLTNPICPYVFKNANIKYMKSESNSDTVIYSHLMKFHKIKRTENITIDLN